jgi:hypothetical protein
MGIIRATKRVANDKWLLAQAGFDMAIPLATLTPNLTQAALLVEAVKSLKRGLIPADKGC